MPTPAPTKKVVHNGEEFDVPTGYSRVEDFASAVRFNYTHREKLGMTPEVKADYDALIGKLGRAGL